MTNKMNQNERMENIHTALLRSCPIQKNEYATEVEETNALLNRLKSMYSESFKNVNDYEFGNNKLLHVLENDFDYPNHVDNINQHVIFDVDSSCKERVVQSHQTSGICCPELSQEIENDKVVLSTTTIGKILNAIPGDIQEYRFIHGDEFNTEFHLSNDDNIANLKKIKNIEDTLKMFSISIRTKDFLEKMHDVEIHIREYAYLYKPTQIDLLTTFFERELKNSKNIDKQVHFFNVMRNITLRLDDVQKLISFLNGFTTVDDAERYKNCSEEQFYFYKLLKEFSTRIRKCELLWRKYNLVVEYVGILNELNMNNITNVPKIECLVWPGRTL